jgi:DNA-binding SARP family transcriptional activator
MLRVTLLGAGAVELDGQPVPELAAPRPLSLIAHLVLHRNAAQPRAAVAFRLWPESTEQQAHTNLRHLLHDLRRAIPDLDDIVDVRPRTLQWRPDARSTGR